ncbi:hypothetical protein [Parvibaculum sp.]|uniref:hypothetical protein n=1 Tax=Parvibaculum sp. TaxID=2024848 RepID=UPI002620916A|nr:hypothetical protein [Parvibaculum sp.]MCW5728156.1 hypothetical protein [Parvibaculum sp.]
MPFALPLIVAGGGAVAGWWAGSKATAATIGSYQGAQEATKEGVSNVMVVAAVIGIFLVGKSQKWW